MADEEVKPVEETVTETTEAETAQEELPLEAAAEETAEAEKPIEAEPDKPAEVVATKEDWKDKELKAKYRRQKELERELAEERTRRELAEAKAAKFNQIKPEEAATVSADDVERQVQERMAQQRYTEESNKINDTGAKTYGEEWTGAISNLEILGGFDMPTMNGVLATDDPAKVLFELGKNPDRYHSLMRLPLERRILEMGKLAMAPAVKPMSNAPAPVNPVSGRAAPAKETLSDNLDDDAWFRIREAQDARKKAATGKFRSL